ncbi:hypothetical protein [Leptospirillum ferriphilum]|uniref:hypothetical protein n=1 Tax=Leptospirillum ferriphilum TaxID=178606 RepID=UPI0006B1937F|nr:hypothetical protein [Leptospirillum ferriphilum]
MGDSGEENRNLLLELLEKEDTGRNHVVFDIGGASVDRYTLFVRDGYTIDSYAMPRNADSTEAVWQQIDTFTIGDLRSPIPNFGVFGKPVDCSNLPERAQKSAEDILCKYAEMKREKDEIVSRHDRTSGLTPIADQIGDVDDQEEVSSSPSV